MEVSAEVYDFCLFGDDPVCVLGPADFRPSSLSTFQQQRIQNNVGKVITVLGEASAKAQKLRIPVTSFVRFTESDHRLYLLKVTTNTSENTGSLSEPSPPPPRQRHMIIGLLKVGRKNLFLNDGEGNMKVCSPLCVLDFYVSEAFQRMGHGQTLFNCMLEKELVAPEELAVDRPSRKMMQFLEKNYGLQDIQIQPNNFVFFRSRTRKPDSAVDLKSIPSAPIPSISSCASASPLTAEPTRVVAPVVNDCCISNEKDRKSFRFPGVDRQAHSSGRISSTFTRSLDNGLSFRTSSSTPSCGVNSKLDTIHGGLRESNGRSLGEPVGVRGVSSKYSTYRPGSIGILPHLPPIHLDRLRPNRR